MGLSFVGSIGIKIATATYPLFLPVTTLTQCVLFLLAWTDRHSTLSTILQDNRIDDLTTLHAALSAVVR
jgi:hypothetical protein